MVRTDRVPSVILCSLVLAACSSPGETSASASASGSSAAHASTTAAPSASSSSGATASAAGTVDSVSAAAAGNLKVGTDSLFSDVASVIEGFDEGSAAFAFAPDGPVKVAIADVDGKPVAASDRTATLTYEIPETGKTIEVPLKADADKHYLVAAGPELAKSVVTPVKYTISGGARPWTGVLQLPAGGTQALNADAQAAATAHATPPVGSHGGRIERIGKDDVELLVDKDKGEVHAWLVSPDGKPVDTSKSNFAVLLDDKRVDLKPDTGGVFVAKLTPDLHIDLGGIHKVSAAFSEDAKTWNTVLFGLRPHVYVYAPRILVVNDIDVENNVKVAHDNGKHEGDDDDHHGDHDHGDHGDHDHADHDHPDHDHPDHGDHDHGDHGDHDHGDHDHHGHDNGQGNQGQNNGQGNGPPHGPPGHDKHNH